MAETEHYAQMLSSGGDRPVLHAEYREIIESRAFDFAVDGMSGDAWKARPNRKPMRTDLAGRKLGVLKQLIESRAPLDRGKLRASKSLVEAARLAIEDGGKREGTWNTIQTSRGGTYIFKPAKHLRWYAFFRIEQIEGGRAASWIPSPLVFEASLARLRLDEGVVLVHDVETDNPSHRAETIKRFHLTFDTEDGPVTLVARLAPGNLDPPEGWLQPRRLRLRARDGDSGALCFPLGDAGAPTSETAELVAVLTDGSCLGITIPLVV
jgi:hypothetical protein